MPTQKHIGMLQLLLGLGCNKEIIAEFLEWEGLSKPHQRYMACPVIVFDQAWSDTLPEWIFPAIHVDRLEQIAEEAKQGITGDLATVSEVMAYMYSCTLTANVSHEWTNVYLWCSQQAMSKHQQLESGQSFAELLGDEQPLQLSDYEQHQFLRPLQRWLRQKIVKAAADRGVAKTNSSKSTKAKIMQAQTSLFDQQP